MVAREDKLFTIDSHAGGSIPYLAERFAIIDEMGFIEGSRHHIQTKDFAALCVEWSGTSGHSGRQRGASFSALTFRPGNGDGYAPAIGDDTLAQPAKRRL